jgi:predicted adenylyl cyclase CyaB
MSKNSYEIEIKSLLGSEENASKLVQKMQKMDINLQTLGSHKQLNHYFEKGDLSKLLTKAKDHLNSAQQEQFQDIALRAKTYSVRTRWADGKVILVVKASVDDTTSSNGTARIEFEAEVSDMTLEQLDQIILDSGFQYQAKWSRERTEYKTSNVTLSIDKNAGYGYLAEFETIEDNPERIEQTKSDLREMMKSLEVDELPQDRLERMFAHYNHHWQEYYGTDKTFVIE